MAGPKIKNLKTVAPHLEQLRLQLKESLLFRSRRIRLGRTIYR